MQLSRETAMGELIKYSKNGKKITGMDMFNLNKTLLYGTFSCDDLTSINVAENNQYYYFANTTYIKTFFFFHNAPLLTPSFIQKYIINFSIQIINDMICGCWAWFT